jgi:hypothetical protein
MTNTELLLGFIGFMLVIIWLYIRWIYVRLEYKPLFDPQAPVNQYGESLTDAIQNSIARGQRGIQTWEH